MEMYATAEKFAQLYPSAPNETYERYAWDAQKALDNATTTVDGVKKLRVAFPTDEDDAEAVQRAFCAVVNALREIDDAKTAATAASGYVQTEGGYVSGAIRSISAGGESISYGADASAETDITRAAKSTGATKNYLRELIEGYLRGAKDDNGINLLYGGSYQRRWC